ncbi:MAG: hypothetical protein N2050_04370, partial [Flavobacteriales bacterium]|nr:hypothetical protein [Flavobacteriales bacterium]
VYWKESWLKLSPRRDWGKLETLQFNSVKPLGRVAYMKFLSMPVSARDLYRDGYGEIHGKLFKLINIIYNNSKEVAQSALITVFCEFMFIPGYVLLKNVTWEPIDSNVVRGVLQDHGLTVSGLFYLNEEGLFTHFETQDRYYASGKNTYTKVPFSAVVESYKTQGHLKICEKVKIIWHLPEGDFEYYKGVIDALDFNVSE